MVIYLDNAATSYPKPPQVARAMAEYMLQVGAPINRSAYGPAQEAAQVTLRLRERLARFLGFPYKNSHVILTPGCTAAINQILFGYLRPGDHCLVSAMEHNAVMRPLLQLQGVCFDRIPCSREGLLDPGDVERLIRPNTRLLIMAHGSNVCGCVQDAPAVGEICARRGIPFLLDAAQTAGHYPVDFEAFQLSALAVPGHKGLLGPSGIGAVLLRDSLAKQLTPLLAGGTGSVSDSEYLPTYLPDRLESGTPNLPGIYGLEAALRFLERQGLDKLRRHEMALCRRFLAGLASIPGAVPCGTR